MRKFFLQSVKVRKPALAAIVLLMTALLASCRYFSKDRKGDVIAKAYDKLLYRSDLHGVVPHGTKPADSIEVVKQFIDNWVRRQVILHQAENNLSPEQQDFTARLEAYRNSLLVYEYESELIRQKLDTAVSQQEIEQFYEKHPENFQLRENIVRVSYVKIPESTAGDATVKKATQWLRSDKTADQEKLDELCQSSTITCRMDDENWISFNALANEIPLLTDDQEKFLQSHKFYETRDSVFVYLVRFNAFKTRESLSPLSLETENIRNILINRRKLDLINKMEQEVFENALKNKDFEVF